MVEGKRSRGKEREKIMIIIGWTNRLAGFVEAMTECTLKETWDRGALKVKVANARAQGI